MTSTLEELRGRLAELRAGDASITSWRSLQLQILVAARDVQRSELTQAAPRYAPASSGLWNLLAEPFWVEIDPQKLGEMVETVLAVLDSIVAMQETRRNEG